MVRLAPGGFGAMCRPSGPEQDLVEVIDADPLATLGTASAAEFGNRLPFLLKVLAAEEALSLQAHPLRGTGARGGSNGRTRVASPSTPATATTAIRGTSRS